MSEPTAGSTGAGSGAQGDHSDLSAVAGGNGPEARPPAAPAEGQRRGRRRRGSRGGRGRRSRRERAGAVEAGAAAEDATDTAGEPGRSTGESPAGEVATSSPGEASGAKRPDARDERAAAPASGPARPKIGDSRPAPPPPPPIRPVSGLPTWRETPSPAEAGPVAGRSGAEPAVAPEPGTGRRRRRRGGGRRSGGARDVTADGEAEADRRRGRERNGRPVGRYLMCVHVRERATQIAVLEGRSLIEHYVSRPQDDVSQIDGNIYLGRVQNVLPGMEAAFVDLGTPKNAVLYRGDVRYDRDDVEVGKGRTRGDGARIEQLLSSGQTILCQVTKNPIGTKGARLTQEVSLPGRFVVLIPNSDTYGISKRLPDDERRRLRKALDETRHEGHGIIVRTAAEGASAAELRRDIDLLIDQWSQVDALARRASAPQLLYREPDMAVRVIREEFNQDYRGIVIDDPVLFGQVRDYVATISPDLSDRVELYDTISSPLPLFERHHVHEQLHKALDRKVWLPSGGSIIIERTEALTVIDVNTGKNVGSSSLEETVFRNNKEAADEIARQLRLRDIGGIIVIDFIDMEVRANREAVMAVFREALGRDKTRTQVFDISELGLVQMTRKRVSEGLVESFSETCPTCKGRGIVFDESLL